MWNPSLPRLPSCLPLLLAVGALLPACHSDKDTDSGEAAYACTVVPETRDAARSCALDENCACGAHCEMGTCAVECTKDADCEGDCDLRFGRCVEAGQALADPQARAVSAPKLSVKPSFVTLPTDSAERQVRVFPTEGDSGLLRVVAGEGLLVQCRPETSYGSECILSAVDPDEGQLLTLRADDSLGEDAPSFAELRLYTEAGARTTVGVALGPLDLSIPTASTTTHARGADDGDLSSAPDLDGVYVGWLTPGKAGIFLPGDDASTTMAGAEIQVPVTVELWADGTLRLTDTLAAGGVIFPGLVGAVDLSTLSLSLPAVRVLGDEADPSSPYAPEVLMDSSSGGRLDPLTGTYVSGVLLSSYPGLSDYGTPFSTWILYALRDGSATLGTEPSPDSGETLAGDVATRMDTPLDEEVAGEDPFDTILCASSGGLGEGWATLPGETDASDDDTCLATGDLGCGEAESPWQTLPLLSWSGDQAFDVAACSADLMDVGAWGSCGADTCTCLDAPGQAAAMAMSLEDARTALLSDDYDDVALANTRLGHRLAQQWLEVAAWLPTEALGQAEYGVAAGAVDEGADIGFDGVFTAVEASLSAWDLILHPRIATALLVLPDAVGQSPDYRADWLPEDTDDTCADNVSADDQVQDVGLPVGILDTLSAQANAITGLIRESRLDPDAVDPDQAAELMGRFLRVAMPARGLAEGMYARAAASGEPAWQSDWEVASEGVQSALTAATQSLNDDDNPLGVQEVDLPLYGLSDQVGASDRFFALSQNLLGSGDCETAGESDGYATEACLAAHTALDDARDAWNAEQSRDWSNEGAANDQARREEAIQRQFGDPVWSLCGYPAELSGVEVMAHPELVDPSTCYFPNDALVQQYEETMGDFDPATDCPTDAASADDYVESLTEAGIAEQMCVIGRLQDDLGPAIEVANETEGCKKVRDWLSESGAWDLTKDPPVTTVHKEDATLVSVGESFSYTCAYATDLDGDGSTDEWTLSGKYGSTCIAYGLTFDGETRYVSKQCSEMPDDALRGLNPDDYKDAVATVTLECAQVADTVDARRPLTDPGSCEIASDCPQGMTCEGGACALESTEDPAPSCFRGSLGEAALEVQAAALEVQTAQAELADYSDKYDIAMQGCFILQEGDEKVDELIAQHNVEMEAMGAVKLAAQTASHVLKAAGKSSNGLAEAASGGSEGAFAVAEAVADTVADSMEYGMQVADLEHEALMDEAKAETAELQCYNDAEMSFVGADAAALKVKTAILAAAEAQAKLDNLKTLAAGDLSEGLAALDNEIARRRSPLGTQYWSDEKLETYASKMRRARRAAWLAMRVVEYEQQTTLDAARADILAARAPDDLGAVLSDLQDRSSTGTVNGSSPTDLLVVLSLKDHLAQLSSFEGMPDGYQDMTADQRFQWWLTDDALAVYDTDGTLLGREIPFTLSPDDGTFDALNNIPLRTDTDCAERLWSVNVSILGDDAYTGGDSTFGRVVIKKANTFYSQWCDDTDRETALQEASTRPELNLLLDPQDDAWSAEELSSDAIDAYTSAQITAYIGVTRDELEDEAYFNGDSQQLAGRGLYGDYRVFIPEEWIATAGESSSEGLDLGAFEDILIRFDYVAAARD